MVGVGVSHSECEGHSNCAGHSNCVSFKLCLVVSFKLCIGDKVREGVVRGVCVLRL